MPPLIPLLDRYKAALASGERLADTPYQPRWQKDPSSQTIRVYVEAIVNGQFDQRAAGTFLYGMMMGGPPLVFAPDPKATAPYLIHPDCAWWTPIWNEAALICAWFSSPATPSDAAVQYQDYLMQCVARAKQATEALCGLLPGGTTALGDTSPHAVNAYRRTK